MEIEITNKTEFQKTLTRLIELLRDNSHDGQANVVQQLLDTLIQGDKNKFLKNITSIDMWGGAGAVWEVGVFRSNKDEGEFWSQMVQLTNEMKVVGIKCERAYSTADIFKKELKRTEAK